MIIFTLFFLFSFAAVEEKKAEITQRELQKLTPDEERLLPFIDQTGALNGAIVERFQLPPPSVSEQDVVNN